jgi:hypothetical protein
MAFARPEHSREEVNAAGKVLVEAYSRGAENWSAAELAHYYDGLPVVNNWRSAHAHPLNTFQTNLRLVARRFDGDALIAQRTKRLVSIATKLERQPRMKLTQMQDIGGCRAVLKSVSEVRDLVAYYEKESRIKHKRATLDDYIAEPKDSGYRSVHIVYRYFSDKRTTRIYNDLKIEMQIRSRYQHAWATAVETVGAFVHQALKSSRGEEDWLRFFQLMGTAIAIRERQPIVPNTPEDRTELVAELDAYANKLDVENRLRGYMDAVQAVRATANPQDRYYLLQLDPREGTLMVTGFASYQLPQAQERYAEAEKRVQQSPGTDAVLVSVESLAALERAYPNYFADTRMFLELMKQALTGHQRGISVPPLKHEGRAALEGGGTLTANARVRRG